MCVCDAWVCVCTYASTVHVTDPSGTFITPTCPLFPLISICIYVSFGFHGYVDYCSHVRWWCEDLTVGAAVMPFYILCIMGIVPCRSTRFILSLLFGYSPVFCIRVCFGYIKNPYCVFLRLSPNPSYQRDSTLCMCSHLSELIRNRGG